MVPDEASVLQRLLQQSPSWVQEPPGSTHDVPPELPLEPPPGGLPVVTVTVTHSDSHELTTHCPYWSKALTPFGYCESHPQLDDEPDDELPLSLHELTHCAYVRQSELL